MNKRYLSINLQYYRDTMCMARVLVVTYYSKGEEGSRFGEIDRCGDKDPECDSRKDGKTDLELDAIAI